MRKPLPTNPVGESRPTSFAFSRALIKAFGPPLSQGGGTFIHLPVACPSSDVHVERKILPAAPPAWPENPKLRAHCGQRKNDHQSTVLHCILLGESFRALLQ